MKRKIVVDLIGRLLLLTHWIRTYNTLFVSFFFVILRLCHSHLLCLHLLLFLFSLGIIFHNPLYIYMLVTFAIIYIFPNLSFLSIGVFSYIIFCYVVHTFHLLFCLSTTFWWIFSSYSVECFFNSMKGILISLFMFKLIFLVLVSIIQSIFLHFFYALCLISWVRAYLTTSWVVLFPLPLNISTFPVWCRQFQLL